MKHENKIDNAVKEMASSKAVKYTLTANVVTLAVVVLFIYYITIGLANGEAGSIRTATIHAKYAHKYLDDNNIRRYVHLGAIDDTTEEFKAMQIKFAKDELTAEKRVCLSKLRASNFISVIDNEYMFDIANADDRMFCTLKSEGFVIKPKFDNKDYLRKKVKTIVISFKRKADLESGSEVYRFDKTDYSRGLVPVFSPKAKVITKEDFENDDYFTTSEIRENFKNLISIEEDNWNGYFFNNLYSADSRTAFGQDGKYRKFLKKNVARGYDSQVYRLHLKKLERSNHSSGFYSSRSITFPDSVKSPSYRVW